MTPRKHGVSLLGLLAIAALVMAAFASSAQALLPQFVFKNKAGVEVAVLKATASGTGEGSGGLLAAALNLQISCAKTTVKAGSSVLTSEDADLSLLREECTALELPAPIGKGEELPCIVSDVAGGKPELKHIGLEALLLPIEFASGAYGVLAEKVVSQINFKSGTGCPLPLKNVMKGEVCIEIKNNETVEPLIVFSEAIQKACPERKVLEDLAWPPVAGFKDKLLFGASEVFLSGSATVFLTGEHSGFAVGVLLK